MGGQSEFFKFLPNVVSEMGKEGYTGSYTESAVKVVESWLRHHLEQGLGADLHVDLVREEGLDPPHVRDSEAPAALNPPPLSRVASPYKWA